MRAILIGCVLFITATASAAFPRVRLDPVSQGEIISPVAITNAGDGSNRLFVNDQRGKIHVIDAGTLLPTPLLDLDSKLVTERPGFDERGLLGLAFHPNFGRASAAGGDKFYVYYSAPRPGGDPDDPVNPINHQSVVAEYSVDSIGASTASLTSERVLMTFDEPQFNHNAGYLGFGPDGMLYITTGDGGGGGDNEAGHTGGGPGTLNDAVTGNFGNAQDRSKLLGKVLRIDVAGTNGPGGQYGIPADNPFVGEAGVREEIYAYGLRNPWRATFDGDRLFVADVGQGNVEEINLIESGGNYGWRIKEGTFDFDNTVSPNPAAPLIDPVAEYTRAGRNNGLQEIGISVTGGVVYRGSEFPELVGKYLFGDFSTGFAPANGTLLGLEETSPGQFDLDVLDVVGGNPIGEYVLAFGLDENGEAYVATKTTLAPSGLDPVSGLPTGAIYRLVAVPSPSATPLLATLILFLMPRKIWP
ncbi:Quinoprotein glucose dehydrogenase B precursor [Posidoniimonas polymericola]|uniref:Quinoprotein glucose dehydrogenase B n=1 Tax=Posidoniimonas polymericola TaxID=2528002 RepID=A0A5C5YU91_9BACT|nr:PQQ-dependent sugar dehydrogenase [Posidoniimonas polymericola]TWT78554.1 Quinoprotein glucose dehydrogenase B precursor [Posidoniimonas polymericola]